jgi:hypothetical protein
MPTEKRHRTISFVWNLLKAVYDEGIAISDRRSEECKEEGVRQRGPMHGTIAVLN